MWLRHSIYIASTRAQLALSSHRPIALASDQPTIYTMLMAYFDRPNILAFRQNSPYRTERRCSIPWQNITFKQTRHQYQQHNSNFMHTIKSFQGQPKPKLNRKRIAPALLTHCVQCALRARTTTNRPTQFADKNDRSFDGVRRVFSPTPQATERARNKDRRAGPRRGERSTAPTRKLPAVPRHSRAPCSSNIINNHSHTNTSCAGEGGTGRASGSGRTDGRLTSGVYAVCEDAQHHTRVATGRPLIVDYQIVPWALQGLYHVSLWSNNIIMTKYEL